MREKYFALRLYDPATPSFCTFDKTYIGTREDILKVVKNLEKTASSSNTVAAIKDYFNGNTEAMHNVAYQETKVLTPISIIAEQEMLLKKHKWTHTNVWGFPYYMKCDVTKVHQIVFEQDAAVYRYVKAWFDNLSYKGDIGDWTYLKEGFWGNAEILDVTTKAGTEDFTFNNMLYVRAGKYENSEDAIKDIKKKSKLEFKSICDEIFADG